MVQQRELEVTVLSAQDLKSVKRLGGAMDPYCVAWIYPHMKASGAVNKGGGANPTWNSIITLAVEDSLLEQGAAAVTVEIYHHGKFSKKLIGTATVPVSDVTAQAKSASYPVRKSNGVINVAVKAGKVLSEADAAKYAASSIGVPAMGQYAQQQQQQQHPQQYYQQQQYYPQQAAMPRRGGAGGAGLGLGAGLLGGMLLGSAMDGGAGCGGGCGGGCAD